MKNNLKVIKLVAFLLAIVVSLSMIGCSSSYEYGATAPEYPNDSLSEEEVQELRRAAIRKSEQIYTTWADGGIYLDYSIFEFPSFYGGMYINDEGKLVIQVTSLEDDVFGYFAEMIEIDSVIFEEVRYSFRDLLIFQEAVIELMDIDSDNDLFASMSGVGLSPSDNIVSVTFVQPQLVEASDLERNEFILMAKEAIMEAVDFDDVITVDSDILMIEIDTKFAEFI